MSAEWRLQNALSALHAGARAIREDDPDAELDLSEDMPETVEAVETAMRSVVVSAQQAEDMAEVARARAKDAATRAARFDARAKRCKGVLMAAMDAMAWRKREWPEATVSLRAPQEGVLITDEAELPQGFVRIERSPDKAAIRTALKAGETVPGAVLTLGMLGIQIRNN